ncbi:MAG: Peptidyl-prolyl cis-trans isomerase cyclophilin type [Microgenomates group bacterium GW2011_GWF2_45_18]|nr:MAG: Peptidyl-prolyl cis-trans isomerase cyclophilin type [Microgenomates group bacterium GW2011_GWF1_44_10]KKU02243.1 MAG: Peptidyl-prolyl cis-trans isomerase cyclophilin type [Microgenomates group bacterium GW2011_GWF2_45_18]HAU98828.1 peptidyl-prolyl cis-trans isomerase [Candidatus Paceibacterota bacterium]HAX01823.1 peptidyl-prolyl cis-trans isomerase [Candidatus Paceibacterota bacterium]
MKQLLSVFLIGITAFILGGCVNQSVTPQLDLDNTKVQPISFASPTPTLSASSAPLSSPTSGTAPVTNPETATVVTNKGSFVIELYPDETPTTVENFVQKANTNYYKGLTFHRVEDWVVQGGDPKGNGTGGGSMSTELSQRAFAIGSVGVARGQDIKISNDSQFFVCTKDCSWLTGQYTNFGMVTKGMDVVMKLEVGDTISSVSVE